MTSRTLIITLASILSATLFVRSEVDSNSSNPISSDSVKVLKRDITSKELSGSNFWKRARGYYTLSNNDTSKFLCIFMEKNEGDVAMILRFQDNMTYREQFFQLSLLLPEAKNDFQFDSLNLIDLGTLWQTGDLAIQVTKDVIKQSGKLERIKEYKNANKWLMNSKLVTDFNNILNQYSIQVSSLSTEHLYYFEKESFLKYHKVETLSSQIPQSILEGEIWLVLTNLTAHNIKTKRN